MTLLNEVTRNTIQISKFINFNLEKTHVASSSIEFTVTNWNSKLLEIFTVN